MPFFAVQTRANQEAQVVDDIVNQNMDGVYSAIAPPSMTSYVIVEADAVEAVQQVIGHVNAARKVLTGETSRKEVEGLLQPSSDIKGFQEGDVVEIQDGPYEGDTATVQSITPSSESVTVELRDSVVPIPIELPGRQLRKLSTAEQ